MLNFSFLKLYRDRSVLEKSSPFPCVPYCPSSSIKVTVQALIVAFFMFIMINKIRLNLFLARSCYDKSLNGNGDGSLTKRQRNGHGSVSKTKDLLYSHLVLGKFLFLKHP